MIYVSDFGRQIGTDSPAQPVERSLMRLRDSVRVGVWLHRIVDMLAMVCPAHEQTYLVPEIETGRHRPDARGTVPRIWDLGRDGE